MMIDVDGGQVWAEDVNSESANTLILLHPGVGDSRIWDPLMPRLVPHYRIIRYDVRGYGQSPPATREFTLLGDLMTVLDNRGINHATFVGCSQGGATAIQFALARPGQTDALVLVSPGLAGYQWPRDPELSAEFESLGAAGDEEGMVRLSMRIWAAGTAADDDATAEQSRSGVRAAMANGEFEEQGPPSAGRLGEITAPTVLLIGDRDHPPLIECDNAIVAGIPGCQKIEVPGGDHYLPLTVPGLIADAIETVVSA
jgi:3-oxoadipate enol-lactonase